MLALRLPPEIESRLDKLSKLTGRSKSYYAREAILEHLDDLEDIYLAEQRLADHRAGRSEAVPLRRNDEAAWRSQLSSSEPPRENWMISATRRQGASYAS